MLVNCGRSSVFFSELHPPIKLTAPWYSWNIVESGVEQHNPAPSPISAITHLGTQKWTNKLWYFPWSNGLCKPQGPLCSSPGLHRVIIYQGFWIKWSEIQKKQKKNKFVRINKTFCFHLLLKQNMLSVQKMEYFDLFKKSCWEYK